MSGVLTVLIDVNRIYIASRGPRSWSALVRESDKQWHTAG